MGPQDGVDYALWAVAALRDRGRDDVHCIFMGEGDALEDMRALSTALRLDDLVELAGRAPNEFVQRCLSRPRCAFPRTLTTRSTTSPR